MERSTLALLKIVAMFSNIVGNLIHTKAKQMILGRQNDGELTGLQRRKWRDRLRESGNVYVVAIRSKVKMVGTDIHPNPQ